MEGQNPEKKSDEIDLGEVFSRIGAAIGRGWMGFMRFLAAMRRVPFENKLSFTLIISASVIIGVYFTMLVRKNVYESTMIISCDYLDKKLAENAIEKLDALAHEKTKKGLAGSLGLSDSLAQNIVGLSVRPVVHESDIVEIEVLKEQLRTAQTANNQKVIDEVIKRIEIENRHAFEITVKTLKPSVMTDVQNGIIHYFLNSPYIKNRIDQNRAALTEQINLLTRDVQKMDSLKAVVNESYRSMSARREGSNNVILSDKSIADPVQVYAQSLHIYELLDELKEELVLQKDFEVVDGFTEFSEPASPRLAVMIIYSLVIGVAVAYVDVGLRNFNRYLANLK